MVMIFITGSIFLPKFQPSVRRFWGTNIKTGKIPAKEILRRDSGSNSPFRLKLPLGKLILQSNPPLIRSRVIKEAPVGGVLGRGTKLRWPFLSRLYLPQNRHVEGYRGRNAYLPRMPPGVRMRCATDALSTSCDACEGVVPLWRPGQLVSHPGHLLAACAASSSVGT